MRVPTTPVARGGPISPRSIGYQYQNGATLGGAVIRPQPILTFGQGSSPSPGGFLSGFSNAHLAGAGTIPYSNTSIYAGSGQVQVPGSPTISGLRPAPILSRARNGLFR